MTTVTDAAYLAALEKKLVEAERAIYGFRAIWNNLSERVRLQEDRGTTDSPSSEAGVCSLYPGQYTSDPTSEECED